MLEVINRKVYNTETAEEIAVYGYGNSVDHGSYQEKLYRTKKNAWFLAGSGGPASKYGQAAGDGTSYISGSRIIPLNLDDTMDWLEERDEAEALLKYFSDDITEA